MERMLADLCKVLAAKPKALTPDEHRDFTDWINAAKESDERTKRIGKACVMLLSGKRHP